MTSRAKKIVGRLAITLLAVILTFGPCFNTSALMADKLANKYAPNKIGFYDEDACADGTTTGGSATAVGGEAVVTGDTAVEKLWSGLKSMGLSDEVTAGIIGNAYGESGYNAAGYEGSSSSDWKAGIDVNTGISKGKDAYDYEHDPAGSRGIGLWGWSFDNRVNIWKYVKDHDKNVADFFFAHPEKYGGFYDGDEMIKQALSDGASEAQVDALYSLQITYMINDYLPKYASSVLTQTTVENAASEMAIKGERCANCKEGTSELQKRTNEALKVFEQYTGKTSFGTPTTSNSSNNVTADGTDITLIGDSITDGARSYFEEKLPGVDIYAKVSKHFYMDAADAYGGDSGITILKDIVSKNNLRPILVFALGTNDVDGVAKDGGTNYVDQVLEIAKDAQKIVFVTNYVRNTDYSNNNNAFNAAAAKDSRVVVADWASIASEKDKEDQENPGGTTFLDSMYTHPNTEEANNAFVDVIIQAINGSGGAANGQSSGTSEECCDPSARPSTAGTYKGNTWQLNSTDLDTLIRIAFAEEGGEIPALKTSLSQMANRADNPDWNKYGDVLDYVIKSGWYGSANKHCGTKNGLGERSCDYSDSISEEQRTAAKEVILSGNRTIPPQVVEHDCTGDIIWLLDGNGNRQDNDGGANNKNCGGNGLKDTGLYVRGKTEVHNNSGSTWIFWDWANPEKQSGDPFGYFADTPPSESTLQPMQGTSSTSVAGSSVMWDDDGWISGGMDGYSKMELSKSGDSGMFGAEYVTDGLDGKHSKGPNKITLHAFEAKGGDESIIKNTYESGYPPHFTIDIKNHKVYQHMSIWKTSAAVKGTRYGDQSAGVQIEIMGYDGTGEAGYTKEWDLGIAENFSDADWKYLAELLNAISVETNIPLESTVDWNNTAPLGEEEFLNYKGILGHRHVPGNDHSDLANPAIWESIKNALGNFTQTQQTNQCPTGGTADVAALQNLISEWTWRATESKWSTTEKKPAYATAVQKRMSEGKYVGTTTQGLEGVDCGGFVTSVVQESGWDPDYNTNPSGDTTRQHDFLVASSKWDDVTSQIKSESDLKPGDVFITKGKGHTFIYAGDISGYTVSRMAEANLEMDAPMEKGSSDPMYYVNSSSYKVFRNNSPPSGGMSSLPANGMTLDQAKQFMETQYKNMSDQEYDRLISEDRIYETTLYNYCGVPSSVHKRGLANCATFSRWFTQAYTDIKMTSQNRWDGDSVASGIGSTFGLTVDNKLEVYSVFSYPISNTPGHTGVILGVTDHSVIVGEANCMSSGVNSWDYIQAKEVDLSKWNAKGATYVHLKDKLTK